MYVIAPLVWGNSLQKQLITETGMQLATSFNLLYYNTEFYAFECYCKVHFVGSRQLKTSKECFPG